MSDGWHRVGRTADFAPGVPHAVRAAEHRLCIGRTAGGWFAVSDACPHAGGSLSEGMLDGRALVCPLHAWAFDVETGESLDAAGCVLRIHRVRVADGAVEVRIDPAGGT